MTKPKTYNRRTPLGEEMTPARALSLATLFIEFELESAPPPPLDKAGWGDELRQAREVLGQLKATVAAEVC